MNKSDRAKDLVVSQHAEQGGFLVDDVRALEVWHAYILGSEKWLFAVTEEGLMCDSYYEVTYNKNKDEYYVDHYKKESNDCYDNPDKFGF